MTFPRDGRLLGVPGHRSLQRSWGRGLSLFDKAPLPTELRAFAGFDIEDSRESYPGRFGQVDLLDDPPIEALAEAVGMPGNGWASMQMPQNIVEDGHGLPALRGLLDDERHHQPLGLSTVVHAPIERLDALLAEHAELTDLIDNEWLCLTVLDPTQDHRAFHNEGGV